MEEVDRTKVDRPSWKSCGSSSKFMILVEGDGNMSRYMKDRGSFKLIYSWKLQLTEAMEASTSTDSENFHLLPWKLPLTSMEVNLLPPTSMDPWK